LHIVQKNKSESNIYSNEIVEYLNLNFEKYNDVKQTQMVVPISDEIACGWISSNMKRKKVEYIITTDYEDNKKIVPIDSIGDYFDVKTILRRKKSGSVSLNVTNYDDFVEQFENKFNQKCILLFKDSKEFVEYDKKLLKSECYIDSPNLTDGKRYFLSYKEEVNLYEVKITSGTNNPNILFEISVKSELIYQLDDLEILIAYFKNLE